MCIDKDLLILLLCTFCFAKQKFAYQSLVTSFDIQESTVHRRITMDHRACRQY